MDLLQISVTEIAEENNLPRDLEKLSADTFTYVSDCYHKYTVVVSSDVE